MQANRLRLKIFDSFVYSIKCEYQSEEDLIKDLRKSLALLHSSRNVQHCIDSGQILDINLPFSPEILIGAKLKNGDFNIYHGGFGETGKYRFKTYGMDKVTEYYDTIGSGGGYASLILKQQNRIYESIGKNLAKLSLEINTGIACYVIDEVKNFDRNTGENTQIATINNDYGYNEISMDKQAECYEKMINNLSDLINNGLSSNGNIKKTLKKILPVSQTRPL